jgi:hypothetical protein
LRVLRFWEVILGRKGEEMQLAMLFAKPIPCTYTHGPGFGEIWLCTYTH